MNQPPSQGSYLRIRNGLLLPAFLYFIITLLSGTLIRLIWVHPTIVQMNTPFLIHAHSHIALLGWLFCAITALLMLRFVPPSAYKKLLPPWLLLSLHLLLIIMTWAFAKEGYAAISITVSTILIPITCWILLLVAEAFPKDTSTNRPDLLFARAAVWFFLLSNIGPLALAAGTMMGPEWIQFWVSFYLHMQFSGWITLAIIALLLSYLPADTLTSPGTEFSDRLCFYLVLFGTLLQFEPLVRSESTTFWLQYAGLLGASILAAGILMIITRLMPVLKGNIRYDVSNTPVMLSIRARLLLITGVLALGIKTLLHIPASIPEIGTILTSSHLLGVAYAHLALLGFASCLLLWFIRLALLKEDTLKSGGKSAQSGSIRHALTITGDITIISGSAVMVLLLIWTGLLGLLGRPTPFIYQQTLFVSALVILGAALLYPATFRYRKGW